MTTTICIIEGCSGKPMYRSADNENAVSCSGHFPNISHPKLIDPISPDAAKNIREALIALIDRP